MDKTRLDCDQSKQRVPRPRPQLPLTSAPSPLVRVHLRPSPSSCAPATAPPPHLRCVRERHLVFVLLGPPLIRADQNLGRLRGGGAVQAVHDGGAVQAALLNA